MDALPERLRAYAREALNTKRATHGYKQDNYQDPHDEEYYLHEWNVIANAEQARATRT
jgi:hypothetical protein